MHLPRKILPHEIGFDFDGVIADTAAAFVRIACEKHGYCSFTLSDITDFEVENCIDMPSPLVAEIFHTILADSLDSGLQPMTGAVEVLSELAVHAPLTIITARPMRGPVEAWMNHFFPRETQDNVRLIAMGNHDDKLSYIQGHKLKYFVDDRAETCRILADGKITPLVYSHPWNRNGHGLPTVKDWQEIRALLNLSRQGVSK